ncbi:MAG: DUF4349 domain-containing protein [Armatimonadota bacterium]
MLKSCEEWSERVSAYLDGECDDTERAEVQAHLDACPDCRAAAELYRCDAQDAAAALTPRGAGDKFTAKVMAQVVPLALADEKNRHLVDPFAAPKPVKPQRPFGLRWLEWAAVVVVFAMIASTLFPVFAKAREKSRQSTCNSNIRQIATAVQMYLQDKGHYPDANSWVDATLEYVGSRKLYFCPSDASVTEGKISYSYNAGLSYKREKDIASPTDTPAVWCPLHRGFLVGFCDGHAKYYAGAKTIQDAMAQKIGNMSATWATPREINTAVQMESATKDVNARTITFATPPAGKPAPRPSQPTIVPPTKNYGLADKLQIAYIASLALRCTDVQGSLESTELLFRKYDGFVLTSSYTRGEKENTATATVSGRVPAEKLGVMLVELDKLGILLTRTVNGEDLTAKHIENFEALGDLRGAQGNLQAIENRAKPREALTAEDKRAETAREASGVRVEEYKLKSRVTLAEVTVQLSSEVKPVHKKKVNAITASFLRAVKGLVAFAQWLLTVLIPLIIFLPVWGPLLWLGIYLYRRYRRRKQVTQDESQG